MDQTEELSAMVNARFGGLYREDVVQSSARPGLRGVITKVAGDSDSDSSSDSENGEEDDDETIAEGHARIYWSNSEESTEKIDDIRIADRAFLHGDIVAKVDSPLGQTCTVVDVHLLVDLELPNGEILKEIDSRKLKPVRDFAVSDYVVYEHWLGRVEEVLDNVTVVFDDGSKCKVIRVDPLRLAPVPENHIDDSGCPYYPGQRVRASSTVFKGAKWLRGSWKPNRVEGTVTDVKPGAVFVIWIAAAHTGDGSKPAAFPSEQQDPKHLKSITHLSYTNWQLGDRALLPKAHWRKGSNVLSVPAVEASHSEAESAMDCKSGAQPGPFTEVSSNSVSGHKTQPPADNRVAFRRKLKRRLTKPEKKTRKKDGLVEQALLVVNTKTKVDIVWQDGTRSYGVDSCALFPIDHLGDHDFWPEQYVIERSSDLEGLETETRRVGIVKRVDAKQRTAVVKWFYPVERPEEPRQFGNEEIVSVYELVEHPDYAYCLGDVVIHLCSDSDFPESAQTTHSLDKPEAVSISSMDCQLEVKQERNAEDEKPFNKRQKGKTLERSKSIGLSWVGVIVGLQDGDMEVAWADGSRSKVGPQAIFVVGRDDDNTSSQSSEIENVEEGDDAASWETVDDIGLDSLDTVVEDLEHPEPESYELSGDIVIQTNGVEESFSEGQTNIIESAKQETFSSGPSSHLMGSAFSLPLAALLRALRFAAGLLWSLRGLKRSSSFDESCGVSSPQSCSSQNFDKVESILPQQDDSMQELLEPPSSLSSKLLDAKVQMGENEESELGEAQNESGSSNRLDAMTELPSEPLLLKEQDSLFGKHDYIDSFKRFDSVKDATDHHFFNESGQPSNQRKWVKKIQQEWGILEKNLPGTIYVRVYEDRMDLLRAVIIGAAGTPYQDGLFFFDIYLPPEYPNVPPLAHYHSGGLRLNPNLYETGKVCLSLLNTWTGKGNEVWHPSTSTILQVLVSIQGLVLNDKPYFNEAGYDRQIGTAEGEKNSVAYSENSFLLSCKSMLYLLRRPPKHFEHFVRDHFKHRGPSILRACDAYMQGYPVGSLSEDASLSSLHVPAAQLTSSTGFQLMLAKIIPRLVSSFSEIGVGSQ